MREMSQKFSGRIDSPLPGGAAQRSECGPSPSPVGMNFCPKPPIHVPGAKVIFDTKKVYLHCIGTYF
jgi:hypothetical protein